MLSFLERKSCQQSFDDLDLKQMEIFFLCRNLAMPMKDNRKKKLIYFLFSSPALKLVLVGKKRYFNQTSL